MPSEGQLPPLDAAILAALAEAGAGDGEAVSLPRLGKRLGQGASVLMRRLALMGTAEIGGRPGPGWVLLTQEEGRWLVRLTPAGRARAGAGAAASPAPD